MKYSRVSVKSHSIIPKENIGIEGFWKRFLRFDSDFLKIDFPLLVPEFEIFANKLRWIDSDNSHFMNIEFFDWDFQVERSGDWWLFHPLVDGEIDGGSVFRVSHQRDEYLTFDFYSLFFSWAPCYEMLRVLSQFPHRIFRLDLALDVADLPPDDIACMIDSNLSKTRFAEKEGISETIYFGKLDGKRKLVRIYDKLLDSMKKRKSELYPDLFRHSIVSRVEIELRSQACSQWGISIMDCIDPSVIWRIFRSELNTRNLFLPLPEFLDGWYKQPTYDRGIPDPVLRFREALERAYKKEVDIIGVAVEYLRSIKAI